LLWAHQLLQRVSLRQGKVILACAPMGRARGEGHCDGGQDCSNDVSRRIPRTIKHGVKMSAFSVLLGIRP